MLTAHYAIATLTAAKTHIYPILYILQLRKSLAPAGSRSAKSIWEGRHWSGTEVTPRDVHTTGAGK